MPDIIQFGPFMIRYDWIVFALSMTIGYTIMRWNWKRSTWNDLPIIEPLMNAVLMILFVWKLGPIISNPSLLLTNPMIWMMFPGSNLGFQLGVFLAGIYLYLQWKKIRAPWWFVGDLMALGSIAAIFTYNLLSWKYGSLTSLPWGISIEHIKYKYHPVNVYRLLVTIPMFIWFWKNSRLLGEGKWLLNTLIYYEMGLVIVSMFSNKTNYVFGLSAEQIIYLLGMILGVYLSTFSKTNSENTNPVTTDSQEGDS